MKKEKEEKELKKFKPRLMKPILRNKQMCNITVKY